MRFIFKGIADFFSDNPNLEFRTRQNLYAQHEIHDGTKILLYLNNCIAIKFKTTDEFGFEFHFKI